MKLSILTTISNPDERQDKWREALNCYCDLADEVIVVNGGVPISVGTIFSHPKIKVVDMPWPYEWNWTELPKHLNAGYAHCTGDWVIKLDIDQLIHESDFKNLRNALAVCPEEYDVATLQKMTLLYNKKYYQKGGQPIAFRKKDYIKIGRNLDLDTDLCFAIRFKHYEKIDEYKLPCGYNLPAFKTGISYWNYDRFFKTKKVVKKECGRFSRAYQRYFGSWKLGRTDRKAFQGFLDRAKGRYSKAPYTYKIEDHPKYIRKAVQNLTSKQFGFHGWGMLD